MNAMLDLLRETQRDMKEMRVEHEAYKAAAQTAAQTATQTATQAATAAQAAAQAATAAQAAAEAATAAQATPVQPAAATHQTAVNIGNMPTAPSGPAGATALMNALYNNDVEGATAATSSASNTSIKKLQLLNNFMLLQALNNIN